MALPSARRTSDGVGLGAQAEAHVQRSALGAEQALHLARLVGLDVDGAGAQRVEQADLGELVGAGGDALELGGQDAAVRWTGRSRSSRSSAEQRRAGLEHVARARRTG